MNELLFAQGNINNALKRIGEYKSNLFCISEEPISKSGVIISKGEIVSSKILDIVLKSGAKNNEVLSLYDNLLNTVTVKYVDAKDKSIKEMDFNILNNEALLEIVKILTNPNNLLNSLEKQENLLEKVSNIEDFLDKNKTQIERIEQLQKLIDDLRSKIDFINENYKL